MAADHHAFGVWPSTHTAARRVYKPAARRWTGWPSRGSGSVARCEAGDSGSEAGPVGLPEPVTVGEAAPARPVPGGDGGLLVGEEHAVMDVVALGDPGQRARAVEASVPLLASVSAEDAGHRALVWPSVPADEGVGARRAGQDAWASWRVRRSTRRALMRPMRSIRSTVRSRATWPSSSRPSTSSIPQKRMTTGTRIWLWWRGTS